MKKITIKDIVRLKKKRKITMLTAYDYPFGYLVDKAGIDIILVGDSLANVVLGLESTKEVGMTEMIYHAKAVRRSVNNALLVGDMPFEAYQLDPKVAVKNARRFIQEGGCEAVKIEWFEHCLEVTKKVIKSGIPVMGHIGLTPQTADRLGGFKVQGRDAQAANSLIQQAIGLEKAGCFSIVLECIPDKIARIITSKIKIPTIGIGAGPYCDGQVLVLYDLLGLFQRYTPRFVKKYTDLSAVITRALNRYKTEVIKGIFPGPEHCFRIDSEELKKLK